MAEQTARLYNDSVMRFIRNTNPSEEIIQQWEKDHPNLRFRDYGHNRTGTLANINKAYENFMYGRPLDVQEIPGQMKKHGLHNLFNSVNFFRPGRGVMNRLTTVPRVQDNLNPSTNRNSFMRTDLADTSPAQNPPSPQMLEMMARLDASNPTRMSTMRQPNALRAHNLEEYTPFFDNYMMSIDRSMGRHGGPGGGVLVPANRTPTQNYTAAEITQQNPALARHLGLLKAIRGE